MLFCVREKLSEMEANVKKENRTNNNNKMYTNVEHHYLAFGVLQSVFHITLAYKVFFL